MRQGLITHQAIHQDICTYVESLRTVLGDVLNPANQCLHNTGVGYEAAEQTIERIERLWGILIDNEEMLCSGLEFETLQPTVEDSEPAETDKAPVVNEERRTVESKLRSWAYRCNKKIGIGSTAKFSIVQPSGQILKLMIAATDLRHFITQGDRNKLVAALEECVSDRFAGWRLVSDYVVDEYTGQQRVYYYLEKD
jgi:hypothetical protein